MAWMVLVPALLNGLLIVGLAVLLLRLGVARRQAVLVAFLVCGVVAGVAAAWLWPLETSATVNPLGVLLGDWMYGASIQAFGDPNSSQAHFTIPGILRVPQVYVLASVVVYGAAGAVAQWVASASRRGAVTGR